MPVISTAIALSDEISEQRFSTEKELATLAGNWPSVRLLEIWNTLPGVTPVKKFTDRKKAVARIWKSIQSLAARPGGRAGGSAQDRDEEARQHPESGQGREGEAGQGDQGQEGRQAATPGEGSKKAVILALVQRAFLSNRPPRRRTLTTPNFLTE